MTLRGAVEHVEGAVRELDLEPGGGDQLRHAGGVAGGTGAASSSRATSPRVALTMWLTAVRRPSRSVNARTETTSASRGVQAAAYVPERRSTTSPPSGSASRSAGRQNAGSGPSRGSCAPIAMRYAGIGSSGRSTPQSALAISTRSRAARGSSGSRRRS